MESNLRKKSTQLDPNTQILRINCEQHCTCFDNKCDTNWPPQFILSSYFSKRPARLSKSVTLHLWNHSHFCKTSLIQRWSNKGWGRQRDISHLLIHTLNDCSGKSESGIAIWTPTWVSWSRHFNHFALSSRHIRR